MTIIVVPVDGATNIKLEALDFDSLTTVFSLVTDSPTTEVDGRVYNSSEDECAWYDECIRKLPGQQRSVRVIAPVARGASGGLIGGDNTLIEVPGKGLTLSYTQEYSPQVEDAFRSLAGTDEKFYCETGSILSFPGSMTLLKRFVFEEHERPELVERAAYFGTYGIVLSGHFLGGDYLRAARLAGNEHGYWMCHSGSRNINKQPGTPSSAARTIPSFNALVPHLPARVYVPLGRMPEWKASSLGINGDLLVIPGGHDTCMSHIPVMTACYRSLGTSPDLPILHIDAGSWTMIARIGGQLDLPPDGYKRGIMVQGTVDGEPVVTSIYGGGNDFRYLQVLSEQRIGGFGGNRADERLLLETASAADCFALPNINPMNHNTGPFPGVKGRIVNEPAFFESPVKAYTVANLTTALVTVFQIELMAGNELSPVILTAGGAKDPLYGRLIATLTGRTVYALFDRNGNALTETTTLGAAIAGKAAFLGIHPYMVDMAALETTFRELPPFRVEIGNALRRYRERFMCELKRASAS